MPIRNFRFPVLASVLLAVSACSSLQGARHEYLMRGQVVEVKGSDAVICVGSKDGARAGQEFEVYKLVSAGIGGTAKNPPRWDRVPVGEVRIVDIIDEHFANATIVSGSVGVNNIVELKEK